MPAPPFRTRLCLSGLAVAILATVAAVLPAQAFEAFERAEITVAEATKIVRGREDWEICLPDLTTLSPEVATALAQGSGYYRLSLPSLATLTPETAAALACSAGDLDLPAVTVLLPAPATALAAHRGPLELGGIIKLDLDAAASLAEVRTQVRKISRLWAIHRSPQFSRTTAWCVSRNSRRTTWPMLAQTALRTEGVSPRAIASRSPARALAEE